MKLKQLNDNYKAYKKFKITFIKNCQAFVKGLW